MSEEQGEGIHYEETLPFRWREISAAEPADSEILDHDNLRILSAVARLEGRGVQIEDPTPQDIEIARLHVKMDLMLELLVTLIHQRDNAGDSTYVRFSADGVAWRARQLPAPGTEGLAEAYLHRAISEPLRLRARISEVSGGLAYASFALMSEACREAWERHVFLHHRRAIAGVRAMSRKN